MLKLQSQDVELTIEPWLGGGIGAFKWRDIDVFRPHSGGTSPTDLSSFPMVPFCNRIAGGAIGYAGKARVLPTAPKVLEPIHALHGVGWTSPWAVRETDNQSATIALCQDGVLWPWAIEAEQRFFVLENGYSQTLSVTNRDRYPMPAGLGLHPYFLRADAVLELTVGGVWKTGPDRLPDHHIDLRHSPDWFANPGFDNCFTGRSGPIVIGWPSHRLTIHPSSNLPFTHIYTPPGQRYFCVEPVSHIPDAVNSDLDAQTTGFSILEPGERMEIECRFELEGAT